MTQQFFHTDIGFTIAGKSFVPPPKVDARIVKFESRVQPWEPALTDANLLEATCRVGFSKRRKLIKNAFKGFGPTLEEIEALFHSLSST